MLTNRILTGMTDAEFARLMPLLEPVSLSGGERLVECGEPARFVYFPESSVISCHADMQDGKSAEVGMVGRDGVAGLSFLLGSHTAAHSLNVAVAGSALRVKNEEFERALRTSDGHLRQSLMDYAGEYVTQVSQRAACAILHRMEQRMAVWLLLLTDRLHANAVEITQERIAYHLGVRRAGVTVIAGELQHQGVISYTRGHLRIVERERLARVACECYGALTGARQKNTYM
jgi:CRP-like cAMP-binding protein